VIDWYVCMRQDPSRWCSLQPTGHFKEESRAVALPQDAMLEASLLVGHVRFAEIWLMIMLMLICYERKTLFIR